MITEKLPFIIGIGLILKYLAYKKNLQILINCLLVFSIIYFWYIPKEKRKEEEEISSDELMKEYDILKTFEEDIGSDEGIKKIKEYLGHLAIDKYYDGNTKPELQNISDILESIRDILYGMELCFDDDQRLKEFRVNSLKLMETLTKNYVDKIYSYNKKNPYDPIYFNEPEPVNNYASLNNIFIPLLKHKPPRI